MYGYGNSMFLATHGILSRGGTPPANTVAPVISGTAQEGQTMTCSTGTWTGDAPITYAYQWKRNGSNIGGATSSSYLLVTADVGQSILCTVTATNGAGSASADSNTITPIAALDPDAQAFITAAGITDPTQQSAINTLVVDLKGYNIWTKFKAIYPVVGGSASSHAVNLKTPGTFNLTFASGWTHASTGMTPNGTSAYANTAFNPLTQSLPRNSASMGVYNRNNTAHTGAHGQRVSNIFELFPRWTDNKFYCYINDGGAGFNGTITDSTGFFQGSRTALSAIRLNRNTTQFTGTQASNGDSNGNLWIGASNNGSTGTFFDNRQIAFFYIAEGFDNTEMQNNYTAVQAFQTTLNR